MMLRSRHALFDWRNVKLVVFDVDGTLYNQRRLRAIMARDITLHAIMSRRLRVVSVIRTYRRIRERMGEEEVKDVRRRAISETAARTGCRMEEVGSIINEWMEERPLPYLGSCRFPGLTELFAGLRHSGKTIGIFSDYPADQKLAALGLKADFLVSAEDESIGVPKPHPRGLVCLMSRAGVAADETVLIGDRIERDGMAARRAGVRCLIRSSKSYREWLTFTRFDEPLFAAVLGIARR